MTFIEFLQNEHAKNYNGIDDDMPDSFDTWLAGIQADDWIDLGEEYGELQLIKGHTDPKNEQ